MIRDTIDLVRMAGAENLFGRFLRGEDAFLHDLLPGVDSAFGDAPRPAATVDDAVRNTLFASLADANARIGVENNIVSRLRQAPGSTTRVVVTGQQPGVLGGPLMALYKAATAIELAGVIETRTGDPCIPIFWSGADDVDFAEIREGVFLGAGCEPVTAKLPTAAHQVGQPVGGVSADADAGAWRSVKPLLEKNAAFGDAAAVVDASLVAGRDHHEVSASILVALTGGRMAVIDGRDPLLRRAARDLILKCYDEQQQLTATVADFGGELESHGMHAQIDAASSSLVFVMEDGYRRAVPEDQREVVREALSGDAALASPGVMMRNLIQDAVLAPAAVVLGPAEIAYRAQLAPLYRTLSIHRPAVFPRLFATWVPSVFVDAAAPGDVPLAILASEPARFRGDVYAGMTDGRVAAAADKLRAEFDESRKRFFETMDSVSGADSSEKLRRRFDDVGKRLNAVLDSVGETGKATALGRWPALEHTVDVFARRGNPQERYLSALTPLAHCGSAAGEAITTIAREHVAATMDGSAHHVVYSIP